MGITGLLLGGHNLLPIGMPFGSNLPLIRVAIRELARSNSQ
jgi:hypothetical protein